MPQKVFIYCLKDPRNGDVRYIGQTNGLKRRFKEHLKNSLKKRSPLGNWLRSLNGEKPVLAVLHEVAEHESWEEEERRYISCARAIGVDLVNATDGGEGHCGPLSPEHRAKAVAQCAAMSAANKGVPRSPEYRAAISAAKTGVPKSPGHRAALSAALKGRPGTLRTPKWRAALSAALTGVPKSPEHRAAMSAAKEGVPRGPHSPEHRAAMRVPKWSGHGAAVSAALTGVPKSPEHCAAMSASRKGVPWTQAQREAHERGKLAKSSTK